MRSMRSSEGRATAVRAAVIAAVLGVLLSGCASHRKVQAFVLPPFTPVELAKLPEPSEPPMVEGDDDEEDLPPVPVAEGAAEPKRQRRRPAKVVVQSPPPETPPVQVAAAAEPPPEGASVIGEFTPGGDQDPKVQQDASGLIAANEKRLSALSPEIVRSQPALVSNARNFQKQAAAALKAGDAAGAKTLATKAKLLLDDLEKTGS